MLQRRPLQQRWPRNVFEVDCCAEVLPDSRLLVSGKIRGEPSGRAGDDTDNRFALKNARSGLRVDAELLLSFGATGAALASELERGR